MKTSCGKLYVHHRDDKGIFEVFHKDGDGGGMRRSSRRRSGACVVALRSRWSSTSRYQAAERVLVPPSRPGAETAARSIPAQTPMSRPSSGTSRTSRQCSGVPSPAAAAAPAPAASGKRPASRSRGGGRPGGLPRLRQPDERQEGCLKCGRADVEC
jgi:hypothetical protein